MTTPTTNQSNFDRAMSLARGRYQRNIIRQVETLGGSTLRGRARQYYGRYQNSARNLLSRIKAANIPHHIEPGPRGGWHCATLVIDEVIDEVQHENPIQ